MNRKQYCSAISSLSEVAADIGVPVRFYSPQTMQGIIPGLAGGFAGRPRGLSMVGIRRGLSAVKTVYVLAHELGHADEWYSLPAAEQYRHMRLGCALSWFMDNDVPVPDDLISFMVEREMVACDFAEETLAELEIPVPRKNIREYRQLAVGNFERLMRSSGRA